MRFALYEGEIVDIDGCLSQLSVIKYTEEMCLKYVRGLKEIENFLRKSYGSLIYSCHTRKKKKPCNQGFFFRGANQIWTGDRGVADLCLTTWLWRHIECLFRITKISGFVNPKMKKYFENLNQFEVVRIIIKITGKKTFEKFHNLTLLTMALQIV